MFSQYNGGETAHTQHSLNILLMKMKARQIHSHDQIPLDSDLSCFCA
jgi:hypothetical protein